VTSHDFIDASDFRWDDLRCRPRRVAGQYSCFDESHSRKLVTLPARNSTHSTTPGQLILLKCPIPSRTGISYRLQSEPIIAHIPQVDPLLTIHLHGNELIFPHHRHRFWLQDRVVIERSFMRNTFQVAFVNHQSSKCRIHVQCVSHRHAAQVRSIGRPSRLRSVYHKKR
jgi:serine/arginine repetitive matrix protein 2